MPGPDPDRDAENDPVGDGGYLGPYREAVRTHGPSFESMLWASREKQIGRFEVLCEVLPPAGGVVLDAGAGIGDFAGFMIDRGHAFDRFIALEAVAEMATVARDREFDGVEVYEVDFASDPDSFRRFNPDVVYFSGSLNTFDAGAAIAVVERAFAAARLGVAFNFLSARHHIRNPIDSYPARRFDPVPMLDRCLALTPNVRFRQDYFRGHDATISLVHPA